MSSNFPMYNQNVFGITSFNQYTLSAFHPYSLYHYTVTIVSPVFPEAPSEEIEVPEVTLEDFKKWSGAFLDMEIDDPDKTLYPIASALLEIAPEFIDVELFGDKNDYATYKRVVSYYVGHYLELHLELLKDEKNKQNFTPENAEYKIELDIPQGSLQDFRRTRFGQMFWSLYGAIVKWAFQTRFPTWGAI